MLQRSHSVHCHLVLGEWRVLALDRCRLHRLKVLPFSIRLSVCCGVRDHFADATDPEGSPLYSPEAVGDALSVVVRQSGCVPRPAAVANLFEPNELISQPFSPAGVIDRCRRCICCGGDIVWLPGIAPCCEFMLAVVNRQETVKNSRCTGSGHDCGRSEQCLRLILQRPRDQL